MNTRIYLNKTRSLQEAKSATNHWLMQRISAVLLVILLIWFIYFIYQINKSDLHTILQKLKHPFNLANFVLLTLISLYHGTIGMQVIIQDYIYNLKVRNLLILALNIFSIITIILFIAAIVYFMAIDF